jgi:hypothetical protein
MNFINKLKNEIKCRIRFYLKNDNFEAFENLRNEWKNIRHNSEDILSENIKDKNILFVSGVLGLDSWSSSITSYLAYGYLLNNYNVSILSCDAGLPLCEFNQRGNGELINTRYADTITVSCESKLCQKCIKNSDILYNSLEFQYLKLSEYIDNEQIDNAISMIELISNNELKSFVYKKINVGEHAFSTALRLLKKGDINYQDRNEVEILKKALISSIVYVDRLEIFFNRYSFDIIFTVHGVYLFHGLIVDYGKLLNIKVIVYGAPYRKGTLMFSKDKTYHLSLTEENGSSYSTLVLNKDMENEVMNYLDSKVLGGRENVNYHPNPILDKNRILELLNLNSDDEIVSLYTNVLWDAQIYYQYNVFENMLEWLFFTIDYFSKQDRYKLVIRIHPAEHKGGIASKQPIYEEIIKKYNKLPKNIVVIKPESDISSYTLAESSKATIIYGTKMGLELAYRKIPVIVCGESYSRNKGFSFDIGSKKHYVKLLDNINTLIVTEEMKNEAIRFTYYWVFQKMIDFPNLSFDVHNQGGNNNFYNIKQLKEIKNDINIKKIIEAVNENKDITISK